MLPFNKKNIDSLLKRNIPIDVLVSKFEDKHRNIIYRYIANSEYRHILSEVDTKFYQISYKDFKKAYYKTKNESELKSLYPVAYRHGIENGWIDKITKELCEVGNITDDVQNERQYTFSYAECKMLAQKYVFVEKFKDSYKSHYYRCKVSGWLKNIIFKCKDETEYAEYKECKMLASKCEYLYEFYNKYKTYADKSDKRGWIRDFNLKSVSDSDNYTTVYNDCLENYTEPIHTGYFTRANNIDDTDSEFDSSCSRSIYNKEYVDCMISAMECKNLNEFKYRFLHRYIAANSNGWLKDYTWFKTYCYKSYDDCYNAALKYSSRNDFKNNDRNTYDKARRENWLDDFTWLKCG